MRVLKYKYPAPLCKKFTIKTGNLLNKKCGCVFFAYIIPLYQCGALPPWSLQTSIFKGLGGFMTRYLTVTVIITALFTNYAMADMTQEQCEYCLTKAKESVADANKDCEDYINRTDISWIKKELYYSANCLAPNFHVYFEKRYPTWQQDCNNFYSGDTSYTRLIQNVWNDNILIAQEESKNLCARAQEQSRNNPQLLQTEKDDYIKTQISNGEYMESLALNNADLRGEMDYETASIVLNNFQQVLSKYGFVRGREYYFSWCEYYYIGTDAQSNEHHYWHCEASKFNSLIFAVCNSITKTGNDIPTFADCDLTEVAQKYANQKQDSNCPL